MTAFERWHVGPWTGRGTTPGEPFAPGLRRTPDELNFDVVGLSRLLGRRLPAEEEMLVRRWQGELRPTDPRVCGVQTLPTPEGSQALADAARRAFEWIAERAPAGYEFVFTDAVHLRPRTDLDAEVVAVEAVVAAADGELPAARLASSGVRRSPDGWYAGDAVCNWSGPYDSQAEAVAAVTTARAALVEQLREAGYPELAATSSRWAQVATK
ncbi:hypothetical protein FB561_6413 [Kribbella amoyensis]|uniref:Uncharacterized protein n=1 Tax=Kribbella amoyensis TaxID=996641 RepID=A0A561B888_9ACTN|nr:hypothetical protein [Kribbella amoyensis]TWD74978.1 hypothetical protein FB561_6413 [Kribbella amoyensis]